ncbi:hypothetical protein [Thermococcus prieurii]
MKLRSLLYPFLFPAWEFLLMILLPSEYYVNASCLQIHPYPICHFYFGPSPFLFLVIALPFTIVALFALWRKRIETALLSGSAGIVVLAGMALLTFDEGIALLTVLLLAPLLQWAGEKVLGIQPDKNGETIWAVSAVLSFLAVWIVARMGPAVSV